MSNLEERDINILLLEALKNIMKDYRKDGCFSITEIRPNIFRLLNAGVHMELIIGTEKALIIDTGNGYADIYMAVRKITDLPLIVVNTHGHLDHTCGNYFFDEPIYIHSDDIALCRQHNAKEMRQYSASMAKGLAAAGTNDIPESFNEEDFLVQGSGNLTPVEEGHVFDIGGRTFHVVLLPGHTCGSIGLLCPEEKILYTGDAINNSVFLFLEGSTTLSVYQNTLKKAMALDFNNMVVSHGFTLLPKSILSNYLMIAEHPDFENGQKFESPLIKDGEDVRRCVLDINKNALDEDYASIVIARSNL